MLWSTFRAKKKKKTPSDENSRVSFQIFAWLFNQIATCNFVQTAERKMAIALESGTGAEFFDQGGRHQSSYKKTIQIQIASGFFIPKIFSYLRVANYLQDTFS